MTKLAPCLWFNGQAEEAAKLYVSVFKNSKITQTSYYGDAGPAPKGTVLTVAFELDGKPFMFKMKKIDIAALEAAAKG